MARKSGREIAGKDPSNSSATVAGSGLAKRLRNGRRMENDFSNSAAMWDESAALPPFPQIRTFWEPLNVVINNSKACSIAPAH